MFLIVQYIAEPIKSIEKDTLFTIYEDDWNSEESKITVITTSGKTAQQAKKKFKVLRFATYDEALARRFCFSEMYNPKTRLLNKDIKRTVRRELKSDLDKYKTIIGLDCGENTGIARVDIGETPQLHKVTLSTKNPDELIKLIHSDIWDINTTYFIIEDVESDAPVHFYMQGKHIDRVKYMNVLSRRLGVGGALGTMLKKAQNVGYVKSTTRRISNALELAGYTINKKKASNTKLDAKTFQKATGLSMRSNEHNRDAFMMIFGVVQDCFGWDFNIKS